MHKLNIARVRSGSAPWWHRWLLARSGASSRTVQSNDAHPRRGAFGLLRCNEKKLHDRAQAQSDHVLYALFIALTAFGVLMVYSSSAVYAHQQFGDGQRFLIRQATYGLFGLIVLVFMSRFPYRKLRLATYPLLVTAMVLLATVALGVGKEVKGAARWLSLGPIHVQPAEIAKLVLIVWLAYSLSKKQHLMRTFSVGFLPHGLVALLLMLLCLRQPDFGSAVMIAVLTFVMLFTAGAKLGYLLGACLLALPAGWALIATSPYRMRRITAFLAPFEHRQDAGYQVSESLIAFGSGGVTGVGIGDGRQKLFFLPEAHTDFISAIVGEELGLIGVLLLIGAFTLITWRGMNVAQRAADDYGHYLAVGVTAFISLQAFTNLAVSMGMVPTKGLVLPFISYGGSALLVNCAAAGILLSVSRGSAKSVAEHRPRRERKERLMRRSRARVQLENEEAR